MNKQLAVWQLIAASLEATVPVMLLYVVESKGSSPGRQGFFMAINARNEMQGSIGGGIMEHKFVEMAKERLEAFGSPSQIKKQVHDKSATKDRSGMICSGEQTILIYPIKPNDRPTIDAIIECLQQNENGTLTIISGEINFTPHIPSQDFYWEIMSEEDWRYAEKIGYKNQLFIVGGGHCALAFSRIMSMMDFYIHLFDERTGLNTMEQNHFAHRKTYLNSYKELKELIPEGINHYVVIMTFGYRTDDVALRALLGKQFKYFGLLGSKKKIEEMFNTYNSEGIEEDLLNAIHSPVGISIKSQTPEEIAISIAAEIISVKNG